MKIGCHCGATIYDQTDSLPNKAHLIPDQGWEAMWEAMDEQVVRAAAEQRLSVRDAQWTARIILRRATRFAYQCGACGRLYVDDPQDNLHCYVPMTPETSKHVLRGRDAGT